MELKITHTKNQERERERSRNILAVLVKQSLRCVVGFFSFRSVVFVQRLDVRNHKRLSKFYRYNSWIRLFILKSHFLSAFCWTHHLQCKLIVYACRCVGVSLSLLFFFVLLEAYFFCIVIAPFFSSCYLHDVTMIRKEKNPIIFQKSGVLESFLVCSLVDLQFTSFVA